MFEPETQASILKRLKALYLKLYNGDFPPVEGTFTGDALAANSVEFEKAYAEISLAIEAMFAQTSWGDYLTMRAAEFGIDRRPAVKAVGTVTVTGTGTISKGSLFSTTTGVQFAATTATAVNGSADVPIEAVEPGTSGNVEVGTITRMPISIAGINSVRNAAETTTGYDQESDSALLSRLLYHVRNPHTSGNVADYIEWATAVSGVGAAQVVPLWNGNGTVKVVITDSNGDMPTEKLINDVAKYIETQRPIGATVTVSAPTILAVTMSVRVKPSETYLTTYKDKIKDAVNTYLKTTAFPNRYISVAEIGDAMQATNAITDYDSLKLNGGIQNISLNVSQMPRLSKIEVTEIE